MGGAWVAVNQAGHDFSWRVEVLAIRRILAELVEDFPQPVGLLKALAGLSGMNIFVGFLL